MRCLVLAGGKPAPQDPLFSATQGAEKALLEIHGRPMIQWVLDALADSGTVDSVVVVGLPSTAPLEFPGAIDRVAGKGSLAANLYAGIGRLTEVEPASRRAAFCWSDIPLATGQAIGAFLAAAGEERADVVAGLVPREALERRYEGLDEKWLRLREGSFVAADLGLFDPRRAAPLRRPVETLTGQRKSAIRQARTVGLALLLRYLVGRLSVADLERALESRYGITPRVLICDHPELGLDVDSPVNLEICRRHLAPTG